MDTECYQEIGLTTDTKTDELILNDKWALTYHLPFDDSWEIDSYKSICVFNTVADCIELTNNISELLITNCMFFLMRNHIKPVWEDENNINGGCFSLKIQNRFIYKTWNTLIYSIVGETLFSDENKMKTVNGITISPKKYFCIIKIWMKTCEYTDIHDINKTPGISYDTCMFKRHNITK